MVSESDSGMTTKERLFRTAVRLFSEKGYHGTSIRELAKSTGIKESSVYNHFPSKEAILDAILDYQLKGFQDARESLGKENKSLDGINDPVQFWLAGAAEFIRNMSPLSEEISIILLNEMFLNEKCRRFYLNTLRPVQNELTELILGEMTARGMIRECDLKKTAGQYVYMLEGMEIELKLKRIEGADRQSCDQHMFEQIAHFIDGLKK